MGLTIFINYLIVNLVWRARLIFLLNDIPLITAINQFVIPVYLWPVFLKLFGSMSFNRIAIVASVLASFDFRISTATVWITRRIIVTIEFSFFTGIIISFSQSMS